MRPKISIIIPTLNEEKFLPILLESIKRQSFQNYEIIVADANSSDRTREIAKTYGCRITKGGSAAIGRNNGAKIAKSNILVFLDADVKIKDDDFLKKVYETREEFDCASVLLRFDSKSTIIRLAEKISNMYIRINNLFIPHGYAGCFIVKRELFDKIGGFQDVRFGEDLIFCKEMKMLKRYRFKLIKSNIITSSRRYYSLGKQIKEILNTLLFIFLITFFNNIYDFDYDMQKYKR